MSARQQRYLAELGIPVYKIRGAPDAAVARQSEPRALAVEYASLVAQPSISAGADDVWASLAAQVRACTRCGLHRSRTQTSDERGSS